MRFQQMVETMNTHEVSNVTPGVRGAGRTFALVEAAYLLARASTRANVVFVASTRDQARYASQLPVPSKPKPGERVDYVVTFAVLEDLERERYRGITNVAFIYDHEAVRSMAQHASLVEARAQAAESKLRDLESMSPFNPMKG